MADEINLELKLVTDAATKALEDFQKKAESGADAISSAFSALKGVAIAAVAAFSAKEIIGFFTDAAEAAAKSEVEFAKMTASLKSLGEYSPQVVADFKEFAEQLQANSKFSNETVISNVAYVKQLGLTNEETKKLITAAADLASVTGESLDSAVSELGVTLLGTAKSLKKTIPEIANLSAEQLKAGAAIDLVSERMKGSAKEAIQTYSGAVTQANNAHEEFTKSAGALITQNPAVLEVLRSSKQNWENLQKFVEDNKETLQEIVTVLVEGVVVAIRLTIDVLGLLGKAFKAVADLIQPLAFGFLELVKVFLSFDAVQKVIDAVGQSFQDMSEAVLGSIKIILQLIEKIPGASKAFDALGVNIDDIVKSIDNATGVLDEMKGQGFNFQEATDNLTKLQTSVATFGKDGIHVFDAVADASKRNREQQEADAQAIVKARVEQARKDAENAKAFKELQDEAKKFIEGYFQKEKDSIDGVIASRDRDLASLQKFMEAGVIETEKGEALRQTIVAESEKKIHDIRLKQLEQFKKEVSDAASQPLKAFFNEIDFDPKAFEGMQKQIGAAFGSLNDILKGTAGANDLFKGAASAFADSLIPGIGGAVGEIVGVLEQGPEAVKKQINDFANAIPEIVTNIAQALPVVSETIIRALPKVTKALVDALPGLIQGFVDAIPDIIRAISDSLPQLVETLATLMPTVVNALVDSLIYKGGIVKIAVALLEAMTNPKLLTGIGEGILKGFTPKLPEFKFPPLPDFEFPSLPKFEWPSFPKISLPEIKLPDLSIPRPKWLDDFLNALKPGQNAAIGGSGKGNVEKALGVDIPGVKLATGGLVPPGFPNDTFPARLTSGENIIRTDLSEKLEKYLNNQGNGVTESLLVRIVDLLGQPITVNASTEVNQREFANIILQLNRQNARLA